MSQKTSIAVKSYDICLTSMIRTRLMPPFLPFIALNPVLFWSISKMFYRRRIDYLYDRFYLEVLGCLIVRLPLDFVNEVKFKSLFFRQLF